MAAGNINLAPKLVITYHSTAPLDENEIQHIGQNHTINYSLIYNSDSLYDLDNDGIEPITGVIDFRIANISFNWHVNLSSLCTRWDTISLDDLTSTITCYGSEICCSFANILSSSESWNGTFFAYYGRHGATYNNSISAQVIHVDYGFGSAPYADVVIGDWKTLPAKFIPVNDGEDDHDDNDI